MQKKEETEENESYLLSLQGKDYTEYYASCVTYLKLRGGDGFLWRNSKGHETWTFLTHVREQQGHIGGQEQNLHELHRQRPHQRTDKSLKGGHIPIPVNHDATQGL